MDQRQIPLQQRAYRGEPRQVQDELPASLDDLDALEKPFDPKRDDLCQRLSAADRVELMTRYGYTRVGLRWVKA